jgi:hypothetical protein
MMRSGYIYSPAQQRAIAAQIVGKLPDLRSLAFLTRWPDLEPDPNRVVWDGNITRRVKFLPMTGPFCRVDPTQYSIVDSKSRRRRRYMIRLNQGVWWMRAQSGRMLQKQCRCQGTSSGPHLYQMRSEPQSVGGQLYSLAWGRLACDLCKMPWMDGDPNHWELRLRDYAPGQEA